MDSHDRCGKTRGGADAKRPSRAKRISYPTDNGRANGCAAQCYGEEDRQHPSAHGGVRSIAAPRYSRWWGFRGRRERSARKIIDPRSASGLFEALPSHFGARWRLAHLLQSADIVCDGGATGDQSPSTTLLQLPRTPICRANRKGRRTLPHRGNNSAKLTILTATAVVPAELLNVAIVNLLTLHATPDSRYRIPPCFRNRGSAIRAICKPGTVR